MSGKWGGGGQKCTVCTKTVYPAETIQFEKKPYHVECFKCKQCEKKISAAGAAQYDSTIYCHNCFKKNGFAQKQKQVVWKKKENTGGVGSNKFGGGGTPCTKCSKTVYPAETVSFEKRIYHADCLSCTTCDKKLKVSDAAQFEDKVYCLKCFNTGGFRHKQAQWVPKANTGAAAAASCKFGGGGNPCTSCGKTVYAAEQVNYEKKIYHAECLVCSICTKKCTVSNVGQFEGVLYCSKCFDEQGIRQKQAAVKKSTGGGAADPRFARFGGGGAKCVRCAKTVYPAETLQYEKNVFHGKCFTCENCNKELTPSAAEGKKNADGTVNVFCKKCWNELGHNRATLNQTGAGTQE